MHIRRTLRATVLAAALVTLVAAPAAAHITVSPGSADAGGYGRLAFRVPHGCDASPTTKVEVAIPSGVVSVKPEQVPGWTAETVVGELDEPYDSHGEMISEGVLEVAWTAEPGNELPDELFREFGLSVRFPDSPGETLYFPTIQTCVDGEDGWIQIPDEGDDGGDLDMPAPALTLTAAGGDDEVAEVADADAAEGADAAGDADAAVDADAVAAGDELVVDLASTDAGTDTLTVVALGIGALGVVLGGAGLLAARRRA